MDDVSSLITRQYRVYAPDVIPFLPFATGIGLETFRKQFHFRDFAAEGTEFIFAGGIVPLPDQDFIVVNSVQINAQRMIVEVAGSSNLLEHAVLTMSRYIAGIDNDRKLEVAEPILLTHETQCTARLNFDWNSLLSDRLTNFLQNTAMPSLVPDNAGARINGLNLRVAIQYEPASAQLREYGISYADKQLIIEPRQNTPLSERQFFTQSPLDSDAHLKLLQQLEHAMTGAARRRPRG